MYAPRQFREERAEVLAATIDDIGFASLIAAGAAGMETVHLPLRRHADAAGMTLEGHVAVGNPFWRMAEAGGIGLAIFQGPHAYVHPGWYPSKRVDGRAVPTWNYVVVEARGTLSIDRDPEWLRSHVAALTDFHEAGRVQPWSLSDAPAEYTERLLRGIVGIRLVVQTIEGLWKMAQHHPPANRQGVMDGLAASSRTRDHDVAAIMREPLERD